MCIEAVVDLNSERMGCQLPRQHLGPHLGFGPDRGDSWIYVEQRWLDRPV